MSYLYTLLKFSFSVMCMLESSVYFSRFVQDLSFMFFCLFYRRGRIQRAAVTAWTGNNFPNLRLAEEKDKLNKLPNSL